jgi:hypothetical protein
LSKKRAYTKKSGEYKIVNQNSPDKYSEQFHFSHLPNSIILMMEAIHQKNDSKKLIKSKEDIGSLDVG